VLGQFHMGTAGSARRDDTPLAMNPSFRVSSNSTEPPTLFGRGDRRRNDSAHVLLSPP